MWNDRVYLLQTHLNRLITDHFRTLLEFFDEYILKLFYFFDLFPKKTTRNREGLFEHENFPKSTGKI